MSKPGNYELPFGTTFRELIYDHGAGVPEGRSVKAIMPAGASSSMILADEKVLDTPMDYASVRTLGADLGSASVIVIDDTVPLDWLISKTIHFFKHEFVRQMHALPRGHVLDVAHHRPHRARRERQQADVDLLLNVAKQMQNKCLCPLGEFSTMAVVTGIEQFPADFVQAVSREMGAAESKSAIAAD